MTRKSIDVEGYKSCAGLRTRPIAGPSDSLIQCDFVAVVS
jgi:hypothetical protein